MTSRNVLLGSLAVSTLMGVAAFGQGKPDFTGTWELTEVDRDGRKLLAGTTFKETQIWVHQEPEIKIKMLTWNEKSGLQTSEVAFNTNGTKGTVGYLALPGGAKSKVLGSARWEGNKFVYEQEFPEAKDGAPSRIIRTCTIEADGPKLVAEQVYWIVGRGQAIQAKWTWVKKSGTP